MALVFVLPYVARSKCADVTWCHLRINGRARVKYCHENWPGGVITMPVGCVWPANYRNPCGKPVQYGHLCWDHLQQLRQMAGCLSMAKLRYPLVATKKYPPPALFAASGSVPGHHLPRF